MHDKYTIPSSCTIIYSVHSFEPNFLVESVATLLQCQRKEKHKNMYTVESRRARDAERNERGNGGHHLASIHSHHNPIKT